MLAEQEHEAEQYEEFNSGCTCDCNLQCCTIAMLIIWAIPNILIVILGIEIISIVLIILGFGYVQIFISSVYVILNYTIYYIPF